MNIFAGETCLMKQWSSFLWQSHTNTSVHMLNRRPTIQTAMRCFWDLFHWEHISWAFMCFSRAFYNKQNVTQTSICIVGSIHMKEHIHMHLHSLRFDSTMRIPETVIKLHSIYRTPYTFVYKPMRRYSKRLDQMHVMA